MIGVDNTVLNIALPTLARAHSAGGLNASGSELQWIVDSYTIVFAGLLLTAGSLGDRFGRYRALTFGLVLFGIGKAGVGSAMNDTTRQVGGAFGIALLGSITVTIYASEFRDSLRGAGVPERVVQHGGDSVGAALSSLPALSGTTATLVPPGASRPADPAAEAEGAGEARSQAVT